jgi:hypothetical protein
MLSSIKETFGHSNEKPFVVREVFVRMVLPKEGHLRM